jgi:signal transduction histidine kinase
MKPQKLAFWPVFECILPWVTLAVITFYTFSLFFLRPYSGFIINLSDQGWVVTDVNPGNSLQVGDILTRVGSMASIEARQDLNKGFINATRNGETVEIELERQGRPLTIAYTLPGFNSQELFGRLNSQWFIPYIFWLAGAAALLFLRPRNTLRRLLAVFCFLNAAWLSTGLLSALHMLGSALALRSLVFLSIPVYLHLHWLFPSPLRALPVRAWACLYAVFAALAVASWLQLIPQNLYLVGFVLAIAGSLILLVVHVIRQPAERRALRGMVVALGFVLLPVIVFAGFSMIGFQLIFSGITTIGLVALPGFYFYTLYYRQLTPAQSRQANRLVRSYFFWIAGGLLFSLAFSFYARFQIQNTFFTNYDLVIPVILGVIALLSFLPFLVLPALADERITLNLRAGSFGFSANRTATGITFLFLQVLAGLTLFTLIRLLNFPGAESVATLSALLACGLLGLLGSAPFRRFFERKVLGMPLAPEALLKTYAARITTSLELDTLRSLLLDEVLPSLLVRQFVQLEWRAETLAPLFSLRVEPGDLPGPTAQPDLKECAGTFLPPGSPSLLPAWVRLVLPLYVAGQRRGYWLLGQRDPDDQYSPEDIATLQALADQTALALVNIDQAAALQALYFADMERHEAERLHLAAELHDDVLNQMAVLSVNLPDDSPATLAAYDQAVLHIREIINGLRPAMLNYGLFPALTSLVDELNERILFPGDPQGLRPSLVLEVPNPGTDLRYSARVELALFRIVQQACANAIQHAQSQTIRIQGSLSEPCAELAVSDDGRGFSGAGAGDLPTLLAGKHFGLAGMYERAALIGATMSFKSAPNLGTQVVINWLAENNTIFDH